MVGGGLSAGILLAACQLIVDPDPSLVPDPDSAAPQQNLIPDGTTFDPSRLSESDAQTDAADAAPSDAAADGDVTAANDT